MGRSEGRERNLGRWEKAEIGRDEEREGDDRNGYMRKEDERRGCVRGREVREVVERERDERSGCVRGKG